jgi:hypothetical protein
MILASVLPTLPLTPGDRRLEPAERTIPYPLRSLTNPTSMVVLLRGCGPIRLRLSTGQSASWSVKAYHFSLSAPPVIAPGIGFVAELSSDAIGFFSVHAAVMGGQTYNWFVRFINLTVIRPGNSALETDNQPNMTLSEIAGHFALGAGIDFTVSVVLRGSDEQSSCYDDVTCGVLQNMSWVRGQTLYGTYCSRGTNDIRGRLFEPIPRAASPNIDAGDPEKYPLYDARETPSSGSLRRINISDEPGIVTPFLYNPAYGWVDDFESSWITNKDFLVLRKIEGTVSFRSAIVAKCKGAPHSYVVGAWIDWELTFNQHIKEIPQADFPQHIVHLDAGKYLGASMQPNGTILKNPSVTILARPLDAYTAGLESFGPEATKTTKKYDWQAGGGMLL